MDDGYDSYAFLSPDHSVQRGGLAHYVTERLRGAIIDARVPPGAMLDKAKICARLGVSRAPVVEAFARLQAEGFVDIIPQRGTVVTFLSLEDIEELVFIRKALEGRVVRALSRSVPSNLLDALDATIARQRERAAANDKDEFYALDSAFHDIMARALSHRRLTTMLENTRNNLSRARQMTNTPTRMAEGINEHCAIVAAIRNGDAQTAETLMDRHLHGIITSVQQLAATNPGFFEDQAAFQHSRTIRHDQPS